MPTPITIRVRYMGGTAWNSNVGRYRATWAGKQVTLANDFTHPNQYERAATALADKVGAKLDTDSENLLTQDGQVRTFAAVLS